MIRRPPRSTLFPYTDALPIYAKLAALLRYFRQAPADDAAWAAWFLSGRRLKRVVGRAALREWLLDRKSTRLNSSHANISYAVFCLKKKKKNRYMIIYQSLV